MNESDRKCLKKKEKIIKWHQKFQICRRDVFKGPATEKQKHFCSPLKLVWIVMWGFNNKRATGRMLKEQSSFWISRFHTMPILFVFF